VAAIALKRADAGDSLVQSTDVPRRLALLSFEHLVDVVLLVQVRLSQLGLLPVQGSGLVPAPVFTCCETSALYPLAGI
jgi:hypothetical protein